MLAVMEPMSKINFYKNVSGYTLLDRGTSLRLNLQNLRNPQRYQLRSGNCKKEVHRRLSPGQITRRVQDQSHRDIWCQSIRLEGTENYRQGVCEDRENPRFVPISDQSYKPRLKSVRYVAGMLETPHHFQLVQQRSTVCEISSAVFQVVVNTLHG